MPTDIYQEALARLHIASLSAKIDPEAVEILKYSKTCIEVAIPVRLDDGRLKTFMGYRVHHNDIRGPTKGGIRFHPSVSLENMKTFAFWMTLKCAIVGLPFGGAKGGVIVNAKELSNLELARLSRGYIQAVADFIGPETDILAPDMYTNSMVMSWMMDEYSKIVRRSSPAVITGKPIAIGGCQGREIATALGAYYCLQELAKVHHWNPKKMRVAIQGFGNVGQNIAALLHQDGYRIVALSDSNGGVYADSLDIPQIIENKKLAKKLIYSEKNLADLIPGAKKISNAELLTLEVDILIPAAAENQITDQNAQQIQAPIILELANGPTTLAADEILNAKNVLVIPDLFANAGGVAVSYFEWTQNRSGYYWSLEKVKTQLHHIMQQELKNILALMDSYKTNLRMAAYIHALNRHADAIVSEGTYEYFHKP